MVDRANSARSDELEEGVPLLKSAPNVLPPTGAVGSASSTAKIDTSQDMMFSMDHNDKMICYDQDSLLTAKSLMAIGKSAFVQGPVLKTLAYCIVIALIAGTTTFFVPLASKFDSSRFNTFSYFLKFFISFMLGVYVQQAFKRWWFSVSTFEKFLIAIRQMIFMLHTVRGTTAWREIIEKYALASGYILNVEVRNAQMVEAKNQVNVDKLLEWLVRKEYIAEEERKHLETCNSGVLAKTRALWSWIGELVSHPITEEDVAVLPPLLVRIIVLCQACIGEIENLKMNVTMQMPYMYAQLLSILVHVNNTLLAISCGMAVGSALHEVRRRSEQLAGDREHGHRNIYVIGELYEAIQVTGVQVTILLITPMLYVAFLHIAHLLCYPFGDESYHLPTETFIARLHSELKSMSENRKYFRGKHQEWNEKE